MATMKERLDRAETELRWYREAFRELRETAAAANLVHILTLYGDRS